MMRKKAWTKITKLRRKKTEEDFRNLHYTASILQSVNVKCL